MKVTNFKTRSPAVLLGAATDSTSVAGVAPQNSASSNFILIAISSNAAVWAPVPSTSVSFGSNSNDVSSFSGPGASPLSSRADHVHKGVHTVSHTSNTFSGDVTLTASGTLGITVPTPGTFNFSATAGTSSGGSSAQQLDYVEFTSTVAVTATSEGTANTVVTGSAVSYDGATAVLIEFYDYAVQGPGSNGVITLVLYDGSGSIGTIGQINQPTVAGAFITPVRVSRRITPSNASHTYSIRAFVNSGTGNVYAGSGGSGNAMPGFIRITKAA